MEFSGSIMARLVLAVAVAGTALAQETDVDQQARDYFDRGTAAFDQGRHVEALAAFSAGYELSKKPAFLYNMAECARLIGDRGRAYELYKRFREATPDTKRRAEVEKWIAELAPPAQPPPAADEPKADEPMAPFASRSAGRR